MASHLHDSSASRTLRPELPAPAGHLRPGLSPGESPDRLPPGGQAPSKGNTGSSSRTPTPLSSQMHRRDDPPSRLNATAGAGAAGGDGRPPGGHAHLRRAPRSRRHGTLWGAREDVTAPFPGPGAGHRGATQPRARAQRATPRWRLSALLPGKGTVAPQSTRANLPTGMAAEGPEVPPPGQALARQHSHPDISTPPLGATSSGQCSSQSQRDTEGSSAF